MSEKVDELKEALREVLVEKYPEDIVDEVLGEMGLVIAESALTGEQIGDLIEYIERDGMSPLEVINPLQKNRFGEASLPMMIIQEREEVDDLFFDFRPPH